MISTSLAENQYSLGALLTAIILASLRVEDQGVKNRAGWVRDWTQVYKDDFG